VGAVPLPALVAAVLLLAVLPRRRRRRGRAASALRVVTFNLLHGGRPPAGAATASTSRSAWPWSRVSSGRSRPTSSVCRRPSITRRARQRSPHGSPLGARSALRSRFRHPARLPSLMDRRLIVLGMNFEEGPAILSRFPIVETTWWILPRCRRLLSMPAAAAAARDRATPRGPLDVFSTHTGHDACQGAAPRGGGGRVRAQLPASRDGRLPPPSKHRLDGRAGREHGFVDAFRARCGPVGPAPPCGQRRQGAPRPAAHVTTAAVDSRPSVAEAGLPTARADEPRASCDSRRGAPTARRSGPPTTSRARQLELAPAARRRAEPCLRASLPSVGQALSGRTSAAGAGAAAALTLVVTLTGVRRARLCPPW